MLTHADGYARKIHYTCDLFFALSWGGMTGFNSPFPWFYPFFFSCMIIHRAIRDIQKCRAKYGKAWEEYERLVPYLFIPVSPFLIRDSQVTDIRTVCVLTSVWLGTTSIGAKRTMVVDLGRYGTEGITQWPRVMQW
jgi:hypothetical protein